MRFAQCIAVIACTLMVVPNALRLSTSRAFADVGPNRRPTFGKRIAPIGGGYVPNQRTATAIAKAVMEARFGERNVKWQYPLSAKLHRGIWTVTGDKYALGRLYVIRISKKDGRILRFYLGPSCAVAPAAKAKNGKTRTKLGGESKGNPSHLGPQVPRGIS